MSAPISNRFVRRSGAASLLDHADLRRIALAQGVVRAGLQLGAAVDLVRDRVRPSLDLDDVGRPGLPGREASEGRGRPGNRALALALREPGLLALRGARLLALLEAHLRPGGRPLGLTLPRALRRARRHALLVDDVVA